MELLVGTSRGVFRDADCVLECTGAREIVSIDEAIFVGTNDGVYRSNDGGMSWSDAELKSYQIWQIRQDALGRIWITTQPAGLFFSDDGGSSWQACTAFNDTAAKTNWCIPLDPPIDARARALVIDAFDPDRMLVGVEVGGIMRSVDRGKTWHLVEPYNNPDLHMLFQHPNEADTVFASTGYGRLDGIADMVEGNAGVLRSIDFGATWDYAWWGIEPRYSRPMCINSGGLTVGAAPDAFAHYKREGGAQAMLFHSDDLGQSWQPMLAEPSNYNIHGLINDPDDLTSAIVGTDGGSVWRVTSGSAPEVLAEGYPTVLSLLATA